MANRQSSTIFIATLAFLLAGGVGAAARTGDFPFGTYESDPYTITIEEGGAYRVTHSSGVGVTGTYKISGDQIELTDQSGDIVCPGAAGKYKWKQDGESLIFSVVDDACDGRVEALTSKPLTRKKGQ